jgi:hypothetical protein
MLQTAPPAIAGPNNTSQKNFKAVAARINMPEVSLKWTRSHTDSIHAAIKVERRAVY